MLDALRKEIEEAAFMLVDDADRKEIHSKLVKCLVIIDQITLPNATRRSATGATGDYRDEVTKVSRRLRMWSKPRRQSQYNAQIVNAYLELKREGNERVTEKDLEARLGNPSWFQPNFVQMKTIAERNHGKVFDSDGLNVTVWEPVKEAVAEYERRVSRDL